MHPLPTRLACCSLIAVVACGGDQPVDTTESSATLQPTSPLTEGDEDSDSTDSEPTPTTTAGEGTSDSDASSSTGEPEPWVPIPARGGLEIDYVEANQGVGVKIGADGSGISGADRNTYLIQNRLMLVRAFWKPLPGDWTPREVEGRLTVSYPDGTPDKVLKSKAMVEGEAFVGNLERSWYWGLQADEVVPGIRYRIELWEVGPGVADELPEPATPPNLPVDGSSAFVGVEDSDQVLKITFVPFNYNDGMGCNTTPDLSESTIQLFKDQMYMMNPVDTLDFTMHATLDWNEPLEDFNELNSFMSGMRDDEGAEPERYYYGYIDTCSGGVNGAGGKAFGIPQGAKMEDAWQRVSSGLSTADIDWSSETFVHEVGHTQGRFHVKCDGEAGTDPNYPPENPNGEIGDWGFGVINFKLYHPTVHRDYMTYCHPVWASTYGWNKTYPNIKTLSSWDNNGAPAPDPGTVGSLLVGSIYPSGREDWITVTGAVASEQLSAVHGVEFVIDGKPVHHPGAWLPQPDGDIVNLAVPLPDRFDDVTQISRIAGATRVAVDPGKISRHHRRLPVKAAP